jgi:hypothetical protein
MRARRGRAHQLGLQLHALSIYGALGSGAPLDFAAEFASPIGLGRESKPSRAKTRRRKACGERKVGEQGRGAGRFSTSPWVWVWVWVRADSVRRFSQ